MSAILATQNLDELNEKAYKYLVQENYYQATQIYELLIDIEPNIKSYYWYLGLLLLLQKQEAEAQTTWLMAMMEGEESDTVQWTEQLKVVLNQEALRQESIEDYGNAVLLRQHIKELCPTDITNLLRLIQLQIKQENYTGEELTDFGILKILQSEPPVAVECELLITVLDNVLNYAPLYLSSQELVKACVTYIHEQQQANTFIHILVKSAIKIGYAQKQPAIAASILEICLSLDPNNREILFYITGLYFAYSKYSKGIETAKLSYFLSTELADQIFANNLILRGLVSSGGTNWQAACEAWQKHELLLEELKELNPTNLNSLQISRLFNTDYFTPYFQDKPQLYRKLRNSLSKVCQANIENYAQESIEKFQQRYIQQQKILNSEKTLKIGYLSHCFQSHSVGWLARWLIKHHDRDRFQINGYFISCDPAFDPLHEWYLDHFTYSYKSSIPEALTEQISQDEIDILIDLDSITLDLTCGIMAVKPAPVQVTWLGWDASGIPAIDYFIADPYVLPESADEYYSEKIWRLPQTYIAVDGFEVGVPTLRRDDLHIPTDAIVYYSGQRGFKRHPDTARLQMKIIKEVPNSYFLIKGDADEEAIKTFFYQLAEEEGVEIERLRFLPGVASEAAHRANLGIADIVLDTYPYNGATTTLETLWMGIPLVTRVGEQFAARNSYTMMVNAGISEGIAWTDAEYVEWGVRLGKDENLRQQVAKKLKVSRQTAPLWNGKQFTREMEKAYEQMWQKYVEANNISS
ncbi:O-linked N-acetylglucosamine transferase, SPINDLY family protein [Fortiea sp. LEGE XX443]|uniref:O-linked N-acetylglucosamine transferase, SPINDLY family protein n=1 Tax=Fortiea sp. LEGE XX443 TaxID=1828611 RepID=UPI001880E850|nr:O-linked N-acetylglucosamine transferase, SPINDLY family protein [Fortiea sp. LEGE XX443]MBE9007171.1 O-linked N-acetylglucosamine transferase, SPINDLY family protein [Fortiea sp. LEGE XX443]